MSQDNYQRYRQRAHELAELDLGQPSVRRLIAREQLAGSFEWAYGKEVPILIWNQMVTRYELRDVPGPRAFSEAARWIEEFDHDGNEPDTVAQEDPGEERLEGPSRRKTVLAETREELSRQARVFYGRAQGEEIDRDGGFRVLLSCSIERHRWQEGSNSEAVLMTAGDLGFRLVGQGEREDDLIDAIRSKELVIKAVTGGVMPTADIHGHENEDEAREPHSRE